LYYNTFTIISSAVLLTYHLYKSVQIIVLLFVIRWIGKLLPSTITSNEPISVWVLS